MRPSLEYKVVTTHPPKCPLCTYILTDCKSIDSFLPPITTKSVGRSGGGVITRAEVPKRNITGSWQVSADYRVQERCRCRWENPRHVRTLMPEGMVLLCLLGKNGSWSRFGSDGGFGGTKRKDYSGREGPGSSDLNMKGSSWSLCSLFTLSSVKATMSRILESGVSKTCLLLPQGLPCTYGHDSGLEPRDYDSIKSRAPISSHTSSSPSTKRSARSSISVSAMVSLESLVEGSAKR